jgi:hypothetical protein
VNRDHPSPEVREITPRLAALERLALAHDRFSETEQMHRLVGNLAEAEGSRWYADICLRAYRAENEDPTPRSWDVL